jgi:hypothetical protein
MIARDRMIWVIGKGKAYRDLRGKPSTTTDTKEREGEY